MRAVFRGTIGIISLATVKISAALNALDVVTTNNAPTAVTTATVAVDSPLLTMRVLNVVGEITHNFELIAVVVDVAVYDLFILSFIMSVVVHRLICKSRR